MTVERMLEYLILVDTLNKQTLDYIDYRSKILMKKRYEELRKEFLKPYVIDKASREE